MNLKAAKEVGARLVHPLSKLFRPVLDSVNLLDNHITANVKQVVAAGPEEAVATLGFRWFHT